MSREIDMVNEKALKKRFMEQINLIPFDGKKCETFYDFIISNGIAFTFEERSFVGGYILHICGEVDDLWILLDNLDDAQTIVESGNGDFDTIDFGVAPVSSSGLFVVSLSKVVLNKNWDIKDILNWLVDVTASQKIIIAKGGFTRDWDLDKKCFTVSKCGGVGLVRNDFDVYKYIISTPDWSGEKLYFDKDLINTIEP